MPPLLQAIASWLWMLVIALDLLFAVSPLWGWHPFLGWGSSVVLLALVWDERRGILAALSGRGRIVDRLFAFYLLGVTFIAWLVNGVLALA